MFTKIFHNKFVISVIGFMIFAIYGAHLQVIAQARPNVVKMPRKQVKRLDDWSDGDGDGVDDGSGDDGSGDDGSGGDNSGGDNSGGDNSGGDNSGGDNSGGDNSGGDNSGGDNSGGDNSGGDNSGGDNSGGDNSGGDNSGGDNSGGDNSGGDNSGGDNSGGDNSGGDNSGGDNSGGGTVVSDCTSQEPTVSISSPSDGDILTGTVVINTTGHPGDLDQPDQCNSSPAITYMKITIDGIDVDDTNFDTTQTTASAPFDFVWDTTSVPDGDHEIDIYAQDSFGGSDTMTIDVGTLNFANIGIGGGGGVIGGGSGGNGHTGGGHSGGGSGGTGGTGGNGGNGGGGNTGGGVPPTNPDIPEGAIYDVSDGVITGWAADLTAPASSVVLQILVDNKQVGTTTTNIVDDQVDATLQIMGYHGFSFTLPARLKNDRKMHNVLVRALAANGSGTVSGLAGSPFSYQANPIPIGVVTSVNNKTGLISGWTIDREAPRDPLAVKFFIDGPESTGTELGRIQTNILNKQIDIRFKAKGNHGFSYLLPAQYTDAEGKSHIIDDGNLHTVYVYTTDAAQTKDVLVKGSPKRFRIRVAKTPAVKGHGGKLIKRKVVKKKRKPIRKIKK